MLIVSLSASNAKVEAIGTAAGTVGIEATSSVSHVDVAHSPSRKRAERALMLEKLKLLQHQQK